VRVLAVLVAGASERASRDRREGGLSGGLGRGLSGGGGGVCGIGFLINRGGRNTGPGGGIRAFAK